MIGISRRLLFGIVLATGLVFAACTPSPAQPVQPAPDPAEPVPAKPAEQPVAKPAEKPAEAQAPQPALEPAGPPFDPQARDGGTLIFGTVRDMVTSNPFVQTQSVGQSIKEAVWEPLITVDLQGRLAPLLADSWDVSDDVTQFTFSLRQGVRFHDGQEMTADDVIWSIEYVLNPENGAIGQARISQIDQVDKLNEYAIRITTRDPGVTFLSHLATIQALPIVPAGSMPIGQLDVGQDPPPGTGPFTFVEYVPNVHTIVDRFDDYWGGAPHLDRVVFQAIPDHTVRFTALRAGDVHVSDRLPPEWLPRLQAGEVAGIDTYPTPDAGLRRVIFNQTSPLMSNPVLREAVAYAIDRDAALEEAFAGFGTPMNSRIPVGSIWHTVAPEPRPLNLERSRELQQQAGYNGEEIVMLALRGAHALYAEPIHRMLLEAGFNVQLEFVETAIREDRVSRGQYDLVAAGGGVHPDPAVSVRSNYYCERDMEIRVDNDSGYCNEEIDQILDDLDRTADESARLELFRRFAEITHNDIVNYYLGAEPRYYGARDNVRGWEPTGDGRYFNPDTGGLTRTWLAP